MNGLHHAEADQVSWIIPPFKTYFELPQHLECIPHGYVQFVTDVTQRTRRLTSGLYRSCVTTTAPRTFAYAASHPSAAAANSALASRRNCAFP